MAALHELEVEAANVLNTYVMATNHGKIWTVLGPEFGDNFGKSAIIVRASYWLKSAVASFKAHLAQYMQELGYQSCDADPNLCMKAQYRPEDKLEYYLYIVCYVDNILCIHHDSDDILNKPNGCVSLKPGSVKSPNMYLGMKLQCRIIASGFGL